MINYYEEILNKIYNCYEDIYITKKGKLERLKDILEVSKNLFETGKLNVAQFNTIFSIISLYMWECL